MSFQQWLENEAPKHEKLEKLLAATQVAEGELMMHNLRAFAAKGVLMFVFMIMGPPSGAGSKAIADGTEAITGSMEPHEIKRILDDYFNESELRDLAFELQVDYEKLEGQGKADKTRELTKHLVRRGRVAELENALRELRPNAFEA